MHSSLKKNKEVPDVIKSWDLLNKINLANESMSVPKKRLVELDIGKQSSQQYEDYLGKIQEKVRSINDENSEPSSSASEPEKPRT